MAIALSDNPNPTSLEKSSITRNVGLSWISQLIYILAQLARVPILYRIFEEWSRGTWFLMASIIGFSMFLELGFSGAFTRYYARAFGTQAQSDPSFLEQKNIPSFTFEALAGGAKVIFPLLGLLVFVLSFFLGLLYLHTVATFRSFGAGIIGSWLLLSLSQGILMIGQQYSVVLQGRGLVGLDSVVRASGAVAALLFLLPALFFRGSLVYVAGLEVVRVIVISLLLWTFCRRNIAAYFSIKPNIQWSTLKVLGRSSLIPFVGSIGAGLLYNTDSAYIASLINVKFVSDYYTTHQVVAQFFSFCNAMTVVAFPALLAIFGSGNHAAFKDLYYKIVKYSVLLYSFFAAFLFFSGKNIMQIWLGAGHFVGYPILTLLLLFYFFEVQNAIFMNAQFAEEKFSMLWAFWVSALLRYALTALLIQKFHLHLTAVLASKILSQLLTVDWLSAYFCLRIVNAWPLTLHGFKKGLALYWPAAIFLGVGYLTRPSQNNPWTGLLFQIFTYFPLALILAYHFAEKEMRQKMLALTKQLASFRPSGTAT